MQQVEESGAVLEVAEAWELEHARFWEALRGRGRSARPQVRLEGTEPGSGRDVARDAA